ncbi:MULTISPECIES: DUF7007 domain-containing protein [Agrobacterium]|uniref:DUF7007 domain-containing protein n=3 Tax=Agrobacterium tumefaciens complex TaxID=1183400 RepID=A0A2Z2PIN1_AGRFC|nr:MULTISPECIES: hypothetical protein [Agrobacterium]AAK91066.2 conserved hypothetical protein [Agrobacterium fabrum str. C58]ASK42284.1 hypothetical protein [Agrobacterium sp.]ASK42638.1 hypothetical protein [Agrobacterium fabrum str. C58]ASK43310.1 hypothetical protein [Agrobacterium fabrum]ASK45378.1 hypothetical protein [Agrobacterium tumefaciens]
MIDLPNTNTPDCTPGFPGVSFGLSCEGFPVARVGDHAFAMLPGHAGRHYLATGWKIGRPLPEWRRGDFYGHCGELADEAAFSAHVLEQAEHQREIQALGRRNTAPHVHTPWGSAQHSTTYAEGIEFHSTASHGGFRLSADRNRIVHPLLRADDGFYEEDCAWAAVALTFPELFTSFEQRCASETLKDWEPDAWEAIFATVLAHGESHVKDRRAFKLEHASDWIVISALRSDHHPGMTEVIATRAGRRDHGGEERRFLVPSPEYEAGRFGYVIDEARHAAYDGPSSFASWKGRTAA